MSEKSSDIVSNRRATHDYEILETFEAGIALFVYKINRSEAIAPPCKMPTSKY